jgi:hypothetical protein
MESTLVSDNLGTILLDKGLDLETPPLVAEAGALLDVLNYEFAGQTGLRRIDGYERFDGYPNGDVTQFYRATITADVGSNQPNIVVGALISRPIPTVGGAIWAGSGGYDDVGVIVAVNGSNSYDYVAFSDQGVLKAGDAFSIRGFTEFTATSSASARGKTVVTDPATYLSTIRSYSSILRNLVTNAPGKIAGIWWLKNNLYAAVSISKITFTVSTGPNPQPGALLRTGGIIYQIIGNIPRNPGSAPVPGQVILAAMPLRTSSTNNTDAVEADISDRSFTTWGSSASVVVDDTWAYVGKFASLADIASSSQRGFRPLYPIIRIPFDAGSYTTESPPLNTQYQLLDGAGRVTPATLLFIEKTSGSFVANNAVGYAHFAFDSGSIIFGTNWADNWTIKIPLGATVFTVDLSDTTAKPIGEAKLPGYNAIQQSGTRYQTINTNFYGRNSSLSTYGVTGASRGFWCDGNGWGTIYTQIDATKDMPKYVAQQAGRLSYGFDVGSVQQSVAGSPLSFDGVLGAREIATGDRITGLLEMPGSTLAVFGQNTIRRIASDGSNQTINAKGGCFDYTAIAIGSDVAYTGPYGISLLSTVADYGDFKGSVASDPIQDWIRTKIKLGNNGIESGGVVCAMPVRGKNQYRLFFKDGTVVIAALVEGKFKFTKVNYGLTNELRIPLAWSSEMSDARKERLHVVWDLATASKGLYGVVGTLPSALTVYELDVGWGFDGKTFDYYADMGHAFVNNGINFIGVEMVRLYGKSYGVASLNIKSSGIEKDFDQPFETRNQDLSLPATPVLLRDQMDQFTNIVDSANWGLGIKLRLASATAAGLTNTEPSHVAQVLVMQLRTEGATDNG